MVLMVLKLIDNRSTEVPGGVLLREVFTRRKRRNFSLGLLMERRGV